MESNSWIQRNGERFRNLAVKPLVMWETPLSSAYVHKRMAQRFFDGRETAKEK